MPEAKSLKGKHVAALVAHLKVSGIADQTVRNRLTWLRWCAYQIGKPGLLPKAIDGYRTRRARSVFQ